MEVNDLRAGQLVRSRPAVGFALRSNLCRIIVERGGDTTRGENEERAKESDAGGGELILILESKGVPLMMDGGSRH